jgi:murein DD-endopeptidase MepM/ murein hydrolase activator NlpD
MSQVPHRSPVRSAVRHGHAEHAHPHAQPKVPQRQPPIARADWTLGHGGRQVRVRPVAFWIIVGTLVVMAGWSAVTATYFGFRDDVLTRLLARQAQMQFAYEDRIADLRGQVDRLAGRQLLDQEQFEGKLEAMARRQAVLESRSAALATLPDTAPTGSVKGAPRGAISAPAILAPQAMPKPSPINDTVILIAPPEREAKLESRNAPAATRLAAAPVNAGVEGTLARLQVSLDRYEANQTKALNTLEETYDAKARRMRNLLADLGLDLGKIAPAPPAQGQGRAIGGPFVPVTAQGVSAFDRQLYRIKLARGQVDRLNRTLAAVPIRKPMTGELEATSGFGVRSDPFLRGPAMHTGLDFRADIGEPARATAAGTVTIAGRNGGYGNMVEVDHGNGFATRYAHLSAIDVEVGQTVRIGQIVGKTGSTGRSTGPHLHYETRVDGEAVDPQKFLRAGVRLGSVL